MKVEGKRDSPASLGIDPKIDYLWKTTMLMNPEFPFDNRTLLAELGGYRVIKKFKEIMAKKYRSEEEKEKALAIFKKECKDDIDEMIKLDLITSEIKGWKDKK